MSTLTNLIFNQYVISLAFLTISGFLIRTVLVVSGQKWANTYHHLATCLLLPGIGYIITSIIKDDIALSLGMIGALSIIRFRNPVKSPFELVIFFALLTLGVATTTGLKLSFLLLNFSFDSCLRHSIHRSAFTKNLVFRFFNFLLAMEIVPIY